MFKQKIGSALLLVAILIGIYPINAYADQILIDEAIESVGISKDSGTKSGDSAFDLALISFLDDVDDMEEENNNDYYSADPLKLKKMMVGVISKQSDVDLYSVTITDPGSYLFELIPMYKKDADNLAAEVFQIDKSGNSKKQGVLKKSSDYSYSTERVLNTSISNTGVYYLSVSMNENKTFNEEIIYKVRVLKMAENPASNNTSIVEPLKQIPFSSSIAYFTRIPFSSASASSELSSGGIKFKAGYAIDDTSEEGKKRPWIEGSSGDGVGETLTLKFKEKESVRLLAFDLGYARDKSRYYKNSRPSKLLLKFSDGSKLECAFQDEFQTQYVYLNHAVETSYVEISILEVYSRSQKIGAIGIMTRIQAYFW